MSAPSEPLRDAVANRASHHCEYCQLPAQFQVGGFEIDHILPRSRGGLTDMANLAFACPHCNARKWAHVTAEDPMSGQRARLFNPRIDHWGEHFQWSEQRPYTIVGISAQGRATLARLQMNHSDLVTIRRLLAALGVPWRVEL